MQIERFFYPVKTLGPGNRLGIWTIGCPHACYNCSNPELWADNLAKDLPLTDITRLIQSITHSIDGVTISGGEPFTQPSELYELVHWLREHVTDDILIYSGYTLKQLQQMRNPQIDAILAHIAVLIDGTYIDHLNDNLALRGSSNQIIHILNEAYRTAYEAIFTQEKRSVQHIFIPNTDTNNINSLVAIGIPPKPDPNPTGGDNP